MRRRTVSLCAAVGAVCFISANASAEQYWKVTTGDLTNNANYDDNLDANPTWYNVVNSGTASFSTGTFNPGRVRVGNAAAGALHPGDGTLNMTGGTLTPGGVNPGGGPDGLNAGLGIGISAVGVMNQSGGSVTATRYVIVGSNASASSPTPNGGSGTLNMTLNAVMNCTNNDMLVGLGNPGTVTVADTALLAVTPPTNNNANPNLAIGSRNGSTFTQTGGSVNVANSMTVGNGSIVTLSGGTLTTLYKSPDHGYPLANVAPSGNLSIGTAGSGTSFTVNGGTLNVGHQLTIGQGTASGTTFTISSGTVTTETYSVSTATGNITVGSGTSSNSAMNINGGTVVDNHRFLVGGGTSTGSVVTQSAGTVTIDLSLRVSDATTASATYNLSGGSVTANNELSYVGRQGTGNLLQSGTGIANFNAGLAIGDDNGAANPATGVYEISGGELHATLASGSALKVGTAGTGTLRVVGDDGVVDVNGNFLVDKTVKGTGTLSYKFETGDSLSVVDVSGTATFTNGAGLGVDTSAATPFHQAYDVLTAASIVDNGASDSPGWTHRVINGGANGKLLQIAPSDTLYWDTDGLTPGSGGATPTGTWSASTTNFTTDPAGAGTTTALTTAFGDDVVFTAGSDGTGAYTVTVSGTQTARSLSVARGNVTISGGTIENTSGNYNVDGGATAKITSTLSTAALNKTGSGTLVLDRIAEGHNVNIQAGTLQVADSSPTLPAFPSGQNSAVSRPGSMIAIANDAAPLGTRVYNATLDLGNNDLIVDYTGASPFADLNDMVRSGFNFGDWLGKGITSSTAANPLSNGNYALGIAENGSLTNPFGSDDPNDPNSLNPQFDNQTVDNTTVLIKFTHRVDLDLNGLVDGNDAAVFNGSFSEGDSGATWQTGDVDYDGVYSSNDAAIFNSFYDESLAHLPEPSAVLVTVGILGGLGSTRRRRSA